jgi:type I restriction enzyme M protein
MARGKSGVSETRTEQVSIDLLRIQGWNTSAPPKGQVLRQVELRRFPHLTAIFEGASKSGSGDGIPDFLVVEGTTAPTPLIVIEAKAKASEFPQAVAEAKHYAEACKRHGYPVIAVGVAGQDEDVRISVWKHAHTDWKEISYCGRPIEWFPHPDKIKPLLADDELTDLAPVVPPERVLVEKAEYINRLLREAHVKDEYRPTYVGAMMLGLWQAKGRIRLETDFVLKDINEACATAFRNAKKADLAESLQIDEANAALAENARLIIAELRKLNVVTASFDHDYLGKLYELFFRYTGGNTIGQYFTPRHITRFMADMVQVSRGDMVIDPACGTGGFLIACIQRALDELGLSYEDTVHIVEKQLRGFESEPVTAALCVANMILRGDGKSGVEKGSCFDHPSFPVGKCSIALMNPPFPHKKTDVPPSEFVARALEALKERGKLAVILPTSMLVKKDQGAWREGLLKKHTLEAVVQLPDELFQPFASATTSVVLIEKGIPHPKGKKTVFARLRYDGLTLKKGVRVERQDGASDIADVLDAVLNKTPIAGIAGQGGVGGDAEWGVGAYIPSEDHDEDTIMHAAADLLRQHVAFYTRYAPEVARQRRLIANGSLIARQYQDMITDARRKRADESHMIPDTISAFFDIYYGQKELHSREGYGIGPTLVISPTEAFNGCYGWLDFYQPIKPTFVTVAQTGSIGEAFVQREVCGVNDDCLLLVARNPQLSLAHHYIAAAILRLEKWRFTYGRKLTPDRIRAFPMHPSKALVTSVAAEIKRWDAVIDQSLSLFPATEAEEDLLEL